MTQTHATIDRTAPGARNVPLVSVIVPTFNRAQMLRDALETLVRLRTDGRFTYEVIVADNASTDNTREVAQRFESTVPVRYVFCDRPGDGPARNQGLAAAHGDWFAFFDDDQLATPDWLLELFSAARMAQALVVGGAVHLDLTEEQSRRLGPICRKALRELKPYRDLHPYSDKILPGCGNALVSREVFDSIGRFGETFRSGGSDTDFFGRARAAGFMPWYTPRAVIRHRIPPHRLTPDYFRWDALQGAENTATHNFKRVGRAGVAVLSLARLAQSLLVHVPLLAIAWLRRDPGGVLGRKTRLWRTEGYTRKALALIAPRLFPQRQFFATLDMRVGRTIGHS
ncbi:MAG: glycosyltransferase family 2 protein [Planctomycetia bacterium]|nr:glycosyltransferase family 2 protein [Planctomycetia bacterium]